MDSIKRHLVATSSALAMALLALPAAVQAGRCEDQRQECVDSAEEALAECQADPNSGPWECEQDYNGKIDICDAEYHECKDLENAGCSPCSSPYYTPNPLFCDDPPEWDHCGCCVRGESPIVIDLAGDGIRFSGASNGALFSINRGPRRRLGWPLSGDDVWLAWDRNGNGVIGDGSELFGTVTPSSTGGTFDNGYEALRELDQNGDNVLDSRDPHFAVLKVWGDANRNGISEPSELRSLAQVGVASLDLTYRESRKRDRWGNEFRYRSSVRMANGRRHLSYDVFPASVPNNALPGRVNGTGAALQCQPPPTKSEELPRSQLTVIR